ncbi:hypothetical protein GCM10009802_20400 [Streptomyces synnematoformans]|uniref:Uncharacterized protein n=2 Tax=Streptomyces synnematoformans TaxID=415721 RepID=A0ABP5JQ71_9ACTN
MRENGSRDDLIDRLEELGVGNYFLARDRQAWACFDGAETLRQGAEHVRVGHTHYVVESGDGSDQLPDTRT